AGANAALVGGALAFAGATVLLHSRIGRDLEEVVADNLARTWEQLHADILPGILRWIIGFFKQLVEGVERLLYTVDEWLRFRSGESRLALVIKATLGVVWFVLTYFVRVFVNLFVEPTFNPIKHFPVVTVAAKLIVPLIPVLLTSVTTVLGPILGMAV